MIDNEFIQSHNDENYVLYIWKMNGEMEKGWWSSYKDVKKEYDKIKLSNLTIGAKEIWYQPLDEDLADHLVEQDDHFDEFRKLNKIFRELMGKGM